MRLTSLRDRPAMPSAATSSSHPAGGHAADVGRLEDCQQRSLSAAPGFKQASRAAS